MAVTIKEYKADFRYSKQDAQIIGEEITRLGPSSAEDILNAASVSASPIHRFFEWDDSKAAREYRIEQAREMARSIKVVMVDDETKKEWTIRLLHAVYENPDAVVTKLDIYRRNDRNIVEHAKSAGVETARRYVTVEQISTSETYREQVVEEARKDFLRAQQRYETYCEFPWFEEVFGPVVEQIKIVTKKLGERKQLKKKA